MSDEIHVNIDITEIVGESLVKRLADMGLVLVPKALASAAFQLADLFEDRSPDDAEGTTVDAELSKAVQRLIGEVVVARLREPGEPAT